MGIVDLIIKKSDIIDVIGRYTKLRKQSRGFTGCCPIHGGTSSKNLWVTEDDRWYHCFSCGSSGTVINFLAAVENISYAEAVEKLAQELNIDIGKNEEWKRTKTLIDHNEEQVKHYQSQLEPVMDYLTIKRGLSPETIQEFKLGYDDNVQICDEEEIFSRKAIVIPMRDKNGRTIAFSRRILQELPKYKNSPNSEIFDKGAYLYNLDRARKKLKEKGVLYLPEGYFDSIVADMQGLASASYLSAKMTEDHIKLIQEIIRPVPDTIIAIAADTDLAGQKGLERMRDMFQKFAQKLNIRAVIYPEEEYEFEDGVRRCKDFNDVHKAGLQISELPLEHIDIYVLKLRLARCADKQQEYAVVSEYVKTVKDKMLRVDIARFLTVYWTEKYGEKEDVKEVKEWLEVANVANIDEKLADFHTVDDCLEEYDDVAHCEGITTGFPSVDTSLDNLRKKEVVLFGARPGVGKTEWAIDVAMYWMVRLRMQIIFFSLEMPKGHLIERFIAKIMGIPPRQLKKVIKDDTRKAEIYQKVKAQLGKYLSVIDNPRLSIYDIHDRIRIANSQIWKRGRTDGIIIDYFGIMQKTKTFEDASEAANYLKIIVKEEDLLLLMLCQLKRIPQNGEAWHEPFASALKMTGDLEAGGDTILMAWRPGKDPDLAPLDKEKLKYVTLFKIEKHRRGPEATHFRLELNPATYRLEEAPVEEEDPKPQKRGRKKKEENAA